MSLTAKSEQVSQVLKKPIQSVESEVNKQFFFLRDLKDPWLFIGVGLFVGSFVMGIVLATKKDSFIAGVAGVLNVIAYICITIWMRNVKRARIREMNANRIPVKNVSVDQFPTIPRDERAQCYVDQYLRECAAKIQQIMDRATNSYNQLKNMIDHFPTKRYIPEGEEKETILLLRTTIYRYIGEIKVIDSQTHLFMDAFKVTEHPCQAQLDNIHKVIDQYQTFLVKHFRIEEN